MSTTTSDPVWSILPSYEMHTRSVGQSIHQTENLPDYLDSMSIDLTHTNGLTSSSGPSSVLDRNLSSTGRLTATTTADADNLIVTDETSTAWADTVLDNIHNLRNLTNSNNLVSRSVKMSVHLTKEVGRINVKPEFVDPLAREYRAGDYINGYVLVQNTSDKPVRFEMFYVLFEGSVIIDNKPKSFLQMFDFSASYNEIQVDRLTSEVQGLFDCPQITDGLDGCKLALKDRVMLPKTKYKRFFTFKIPDKLLDSECVDHDLFSHTDLPPSLGLSLSGKAIKDFSHQKDITYGIWGRFIGKASQSGEAVDRNEGKPTLMNSKGDEFVIFRDVCSNVRILQQARPISCVDREMRCKEMMLLYKNFFNRLQEKLDIGSEMLKSIENGLHEDTVLLAERLRYLNRSDHIKSRQLYRQEANAALTEVKAVIGSCKPTEKYELVMPVTWRKLLSSKVAGTLKLSFPKQDILLQYVMPSYFRVGKPVEGADTWKTLVPISLEFVNGSRIEATKKLPEIRHLAVDLVVLTIWSKRKYPFELHHDIVFNNKFNGFAKDVIDDTDNYKYLVKRPAREVATKFHGLFKALGTENFQVEKNLIEDLKAVCEAEESFYNLQVDDFTVDGKPVESLQERSWTHDESSNSYKKSFNLNLDLSTAHLKSVLEPKSTGKAYDNFTLVPSFQSCHASRLYYLKVRATLTNNEMFFFKVPVVIEKY